MLATDISPALVSRRLIESERALASLVRTGAARRMVVSAAACVVIVVVLGIAVDHDRSPIWLDRFVDAHLYVRYEGAGLTLNAIISASALAMTAAGVALTVMCVWRGRKRAAALYVLSPTLGICLSETIKRLVLRHSALPLRGYPSGHEAAAVALCASTILVLRSSPALMKRVPLLLLSILAVAIPIGLGFALIALRWHQPSDVIGGAALGLAVVLALAPTIDSVATALLINRAGK